MITFAIVGGDVSNVPFIDGKFVSDFIATMAGKSKDYQIFLNGLECSKNDSVEDDDVITLVPIKKGFLKSFL